MCFHYFMQEIFIDLLYTISCHVGTGKGAGNPDVKLTEGVRRQTIDSLTQPLQARSVCTLYIYIYWRSCVCVCVCVCCGVGGEQQRKEKYRGRVQGGEGIEKRKEWEREEKVGGKGQEKCVGRTAWEKVNIIVLLYVYNGNTCITVFNAVTNAFIYMWRKTSLHAVMNTFPCWRKRAKMSTCRMKGGWLGQNGDQK